MKRFKNVLYIIDGDNPGEKDGGSAQKVSTLAHLNEAKVTVIVASEANIFDNFSLGLSSYKEKIENTFLENNTEVLNQLFSGSLWEGVELEKDPSLFRGFIPIVQKVLGDGHDLVMMEESIEDGLGQLSMRLVRKCPCPVWVIKRAKTDFRRIMACIDVGANYQETASLNKKIIELTYSLAQREKGEAFYLHVWNLDYEAMLTSPRLKVSSGEIKEMKNILLEDRKQRLSQMLEENKVITDEHNFLLKEGTFVETVQAVRTRLDIDVVVMGSVGRSGIPGLLIGNMAERLLTSIDCSVLTVKPEGYISPVTL